MSEDSHMSTPPEAIIQILREHAKEDVPVDATSKPESHMSIDAEGNPVESLIIRNPNELRKVVSLHIDHVPALGFTVAELQDLGDDDEVPEGAQLRMPAMIISSLPMHPTREGAVDELQHNVFILDDPKIATDMVGMGVNLFAQDMDQTNRIMQLFAYLLSDDDDEEPPTGPHGFGCKCGDDEEHKEGDPSTTSIEIEPLTPEQMGEFMSGLGDILKEATPENIQEIAERMHERAAEIKGEKPDENAG